MSSSVTRTKDGVPGWNGDPSTWLEFKQAARLYVASTKIESRYTCGPKIAAELSGAAKTAIMGKKAHWLSDASGVETLLKHLQVTIGEPALPEVGNFLRLYFKTLRRQKGESMTAFCVRHREEYEKMCRSLARMIKEQKKDMNLRSSAMPSSSQATESGRVQGGHEGLNDPNSQEATSHSWGDNEPWTNWNGWTWSSGNGWWSHNWHNQSYQGSNWGANTGLQEQDEEEPINILPDAVQGCYWKSRAWTA